MALLDFVSEGKYEVYVNDKKVSSHVKSEKAEAKLASIILENELKGIELSGYIIPPKKIKVISNKMILSQFSSSGNSSSNRSSGTFSGLHPVMSNLHINPSFPNRLYFDTSEKLIVGTTTTGFFIGNGNDITITGINPNTNQKIGHYFTLSRSVDFWDNLAIRYEGGSDFIGEGSLILFPFTLEYVNNQFIEPITTSKRYVSTTAVGGGDGLSEATAWTLSEAFSNATANITIWVKAGDYGNVNLSWTKSGTSTQPIKFKGYKNTIGDISANYYDYNSIFDSTEMPTFTGSNENNGIAVWINNSRYVFFENIQITKYQFGFRATTTGSPSDHIIFRNFNGKIFGGTSQPFADAISFQTNGATTFVGSTHIRILNSRFVNCTLAAFEVFGDGMNYFDGNKSYNDRPAKAVRNDYHFSFNGDNNIFRNGYIENFNTTVDNVSTHGIGVRGQNRGASTYNLIEKSVGVNITEPFYLRNFGSSYNVIKDCEAKNNANAVNYITNENTGAVWIWGDANFNVIERVKSHQTTWGLAFKDNGEEGNPSIKIGHDNIIRDCIFSKTKYAIYSQGTSVSQIGDLANNKIINVTFNEAAFIWRNYYTNVINLQLINCNLTNLGNVVTGSNLNGFVFKNCNNFGSSFTITGTGNINSNPLYVNAALQDFKLQAGSPNIGTGLADNDVKYNFDKVEIGANYNIGAY